MTPITIRRLRKTFGPTVAVDDVDLDVAAGDLFFLLGPSGCGKTTMLRMIAGFIDPDGGTIHFGDDDVTHRPPHKRQTGMVFQSYALWPHMSVRQNVAFGLDVQKVERRAKRRRVEAALDRVRMGGYADRKPNQLSGGQQQRVALARALVIEPRVLLLDEPLSNLDAKLRLEMRRSIRHLCKEARITGVYVTHDQKEALSMADQVAVLRAGKVMQVGPPRRLYARPANRFVADFLGQTNFLDADVRDGEAKRGGGAGQVGQDSRNSQDSQASQAGQAGHVWLDTPVGPLRSSAFAGETPPRGRVTCSIRPEAIRLSPPTDGTRDQDRVRQANPGEGNVFEGTWIDTTYLGETAQHHLRVGDSVTLKMFELNPKLRAPSHRPGDRVVLHVEPEDVVILRD